MVTRRSESRGAAKKSDAVPRSMVAQLNEPKSKLTDLAYQMIEEAIVTLRIRPGTALSEQALSEMTGIGRTPIREAIQRLAREHLVLVLPQRGLLVSEMNVNKQLKLLEIRREIERLICRSAAKRASDSERQSFRRLADEFAKYAARNDDVAFVRADREFNELSISAARNEFAEGAMRMLHGLSRRFWYLHPESVTSIPARASLSWPLVWMSSSAALEAARRSRARGVVADFSRLASLLGGDFAARTTPRPAPCAVCRIRGLLHPMTGARASIAGREQLAVEPRERLGRPVIGAQPQDQPAPALDEPARPVDQLLHHRLDPPALGRMAHRGVWPQQAALAHQAQDVHRQCCKLAH